MKHTSKTTNISRTTKKLLLKTYST